MKREKGKEKGEREREWLKRNGKGERRKGKWDNGKKKGERVNGKVEMRKRKEKRGKRCRGRKKE